MLYESLQIMSTGRGSVEALYLPYASKENAISRPIELTLGSTVKYELFKFDGKRKVKLFLKIMHVGILNPMNLVPYLLSAKALVLNVKITLYLLL